MNARSMVWSAEFDEWVEDPEPEYWQVDVDFLNDYNTLVLDLSEAMGGPIYWTFYRVS